jgi:seryl-tRNA synthetase
MVAIQEYLVQQLGLPYQVLQKCTFDIGKPNARGIDIEVWFPGQGKYRETHTADFMTDYQSRDLKIRVKRNPDSAGNAPVELVHTNDATAFALGRILAAIVENYQTAQTDVLKKRLKKESLDKILPDASRSSAKPPPGRWASGTSTSS